MCARVRQGARASVHQFMVQLAVAAAAGQHWQSGALLGVRLGAAESAAKSGALTVIAETKALKF